MNSCHPIFRLFIVVTLFILSSCKEKKEQVSQPPGVSQDRLAHQPLSIDPFSVSPETDSCSCFFSTDSISYKKHEYVFAYDLETIAFMKINRVMTKFQQTEYFISGDHSVTVFKSAPYTLYLELQDVAAAGKEDTRQWGTIRVMTTDGAVALTLFYGECSCKSPEK
jgi:hypothetical protein